MIAGVAIVQVSTGWPLAILTARSHLADPTLEAFDWRDLKKAPIFDEPPSFVISTKWSDAGKIALALGPQIPVFVLSNDPRGWAFLDESGSFVGQNGIIVTPARGRRVDIALLVRYSLAWDSPSFTPWVGTAARRSSSRSFRPLA